MNPSKRLLLINADVITPGERYAGAVEILDGQIVGTYRKDEPIPEVEEVVDLNERMLMPGFIDIHTHGAGGRDISDGREGALDVIARTKLREGVTTFFPTTLTVSDTHCLHAGGVKTNRRSSGERSDTAGPRHTTAHLGGARALEPDRMSGFSSTLGGPERRSFGEPSLRPPVVEP